MANRLLIWDVENAAEVDYEYFDWGDVLKGSVDDMTFNIKNDSDEYVAMGVTVKLDPSGGLVDQHLFTIDGWVYVDVLSVGDIPPSGVSPEITIRRITKSNATSGTFTIVVDAVTWAVQDRDVELDVLTEIGADE